MPSCPSSILRSASMLLAAGIAAAVVAAPAFALPVQRTFVASHGDDVNVATNCGLSTPCRTFAAALGVTQSGGELIILDTAGYGSMAINKAVKVVGPSGVYGGISATNPVADAIQINAADTDVVTLRGLDVTGLGGLNGINIINAGAVHVEKSSIGNFTQDLGACINMTTARAIPVYIIDTFLRECRVGVQVTGTGVGNANRPVIEIDNTRIEYGVNTTSTGIAGIRLYDNFAVTVRNSIVSWAGAGIYAQANIAGNTSRLFVINSQVSRMSGPAVWTAGTSGATLLVNISRSVLSFTDSAVLHHFGAVRLADNVISNNTWSLVNCGSNAFQSLSYDGSNGSNFIVDNTDSGVPAGCTSIVATPVPVGGK